MTTPADLYLTTDTHFSHAKMIEYCNRPTNFEELIFRGLSNIKPDQILLHLGDISIGHEIEVHDKYIKTLPCKKILCMGNHDRKSVNWYLSHGWDFVAKTFTYSFMGKLLMFSHKPQLLPTAVNGQPIEFNIHGHFHNSHHRDYEPEMQRILTGKHKLLAIENENYQPVKLSEFLTRGEL